MTNNQRAIDAAKRILSVMVDDHKVKAGNILMHGSLISHFNSPGWRQDDIALGLTYGCDQGWFDLPMPGQIRLTAAGFAMA